MIVACDSFNFAITDDNKLYSWGENCSGQLGINHNENQSFPQMVDFFCYQYIDEIICGYNNAFAIVNGAVYSWGNNEKGQLGLGHNINQSRPQLIDSFHDKIVVKIIYGLYHTLAITKDNAIYSWGCNQYGQLGLGHNHDQNQPQLIDFFYDKIVGNIICHNFYTYVIVNNGLIYACGFNQEGQLGLGHNIDQNLPQLVDFFNDKIISEIICGVNYVFEIMQNGTIYSWGDNFYGQLGLNHNVSQNRPQLVNFFNDKNVDKIISGHDCAFAIMSDGRLYSWGNNNYGQLGLDHNSHQNYPQLVNFFRDNIINNIVCGHLCIYAIVDSGYLYSWGDNFHRYGPELNDFFNDKYIDKITCGIFHTLVIANDGRIYSWGNNRYGQLGLGHNAHQYCPQLIDFFNDKKIRISRRISKVKSANSRLNI